MTGKRLKNAHSIPDRGKEFYRHNAHIDRGLPSRHWGGRGASLPNHPPPGAEIKLYGPLKDTPVRTALGAAKLPCHSEKTNLLAYTFACIPLNIFSDNRLI
jgi:hypothetical protein